MSTKKIAVYPGTFDPVTKGHVDIVMRSVSLFDEVIVAVAKSARKTPFFSLEERVQFCKNGFKSCAHVRVLPMDNLTVDFAKVHHAQFILRGVRSITDMAYELSMAQLNHDLSHHQVETVFLPASPQYAHISSTVVRDILSVGGDASLFLPE